MKQMCVLLGLALALASCSNYQSTSEPELPVLYFEFSRAEYSAADRTITLTVSNDPNPFSFGGIYSYYNGEGGFNTDLYLENGNNINVAKCWTEKTDPPSGPFYDPTPITIIEIVIELSYGAEPPRELVFKTSEPMYLYTSRFEFWSGAHDVIEAKAFIKTPRLAVVPAAALP